MESGHGGASEGRSSQLRGIRGREHEGKDSSTQEVTRGNHYLGKGRQHTTQEGEGQVGREHTEGTHRGDKGRVQGGRSRKGSPG